MFRGVPVSAYSPRKVATASRHGARAKAVWRTLRKLANSKQRHEPEGEEADARQVLAHELDEPRVEAPGGE